MAINLDSYGLFVPAFDVCNLHFCRYSSVYIYRAD